MLFSFLKTRWQHVRFILAVCLCVLLHLENMALEDEITELEQENSMLRARLSSCRESLAALEIANEACVEREAANRRDELAREAVLSRVKTQTRPEKAEVIDDESRKAVVDRLNRPW